MSGNPYNNTGMYNSIFKSDEQLQKKLSKYGFSKDNKSDFALVGGLGSLVEDGPAKRALASAGQNFLNKTISSFTDPKKEEDPKVVAALSPEATGENTALTRNTDDSIQNIADMVTSAPGGLDVTKFDKSATDKMANLGEEYKQGSLIAGENEKDNFLGQSAASKVNDIGQDDNYNYKNISTAEWQKSKDPFAVGGLGAFGKSTDWAAVLQTLAKVAAA